MLKTTSMNEMAGDLDDGQNCVGENYNYIGEDGGGAIGEDGCHILFNSRRSRWSQRRQDFQPVLHQRPVVDPVFHRRPDVHRMFHQRR